MFERGSASVRLCGTKGNLKAGFWAQEGAKMKAVSCNSFNDAIGAGACWQASLSVCDSHVQNSVHNGFQVLKKSTATFERCSVSSSAGYGASIEDRGSFAKLHGCTFDVCKAEGVHICGQHICGQGRAVVESCTIQDIKKAHGISAVDKGSKVTVKGCKISKCGQNGIYILYGASAEIYDSSSSSCKGTGYRTEHKPMIEMCGCSSEQDSVGVSALHGSNVTASQVTVRRSKNYGMGITTGCKFVMKACKVDRSAAAGVSVDGLGAAVEMNNCVVSQAQQACV